MTFFPDVLSFVQCLSALRLNRSLLVTFDLRQTLGEF